MAQPRSLEAISQLNEDDLQALARYELVVVRDFRSPAERDVESGRLPVPTPAINYPLLSMINRCRSSGAGQEGLSGQLTDAELLALTERRRLITDPLLWPSWACQSSSL